MKERRRLLAAHACGVAMAFGGEEGTTIRDIWELVAGEPPQAPKDERPPVMEGQEQYLAESRARGRKAQLERWRKEHSRGDRR